jgi:phosphoribosyl 1,2-cyclic phosphodiesterase
MSLVVTSLNSGSNGNCYYVGNDNEAVLIDAGLTCRETEKRMKRLGLAMDKVKAIFISHEHGDHIKGLEVLSRKYRLPVFITAATLQHSRLRLDKELINTFGAHQPICVGALSVHPFPKLHDAADPNSFVVKDNGVTVGVFTDIGSPCEHVINNFKQCHAVFLEANYDEGMLENGRYPVHLKRRISGTHGHLSNRQALELFLAHRPAFMSHLFLSHLSKDNNDPELALGLFAAHQANMRITVASRYEEMAVQQIGDTTGAGGRIQLDRHAKYIQASLF